jgi:glycosyltransferase involved in cell wall biosynthesis
MRVAFYAPMKWPGHAVPSGDRLLARMFVAALERAGHTVVVASRLRSWEGTGDVARQARIAAVGARMAERLLRRYRARTELAPDLWFTYHLYHRAPDWLGPVVTAGLSIPYVVAEASVARKQTHGPWRDGYAAALAAVRRADAVICVNPGDAPGIALAREGRAPPLQLPPFFDVGAFVAAADEPQAQGALRGLDLPRDSPRLVAVAMMRHRDKLDSYRVLAAALGRLRHRSWHLVVVGDGEARAEVEQAFAPFGAQRVRFVGSQPAPVIAALLGQCDLFVWPAINEAIGMAMLEAQACGAPVVAGRSAGVAAVVSDRETGLLVPLGDNAAFAAAIDELLGEPARRAAMAQRAREQARLRHDLSSAAAFLDAVLSDARAARGLAAA